MNCCRQAVKMGVSRGTRDTSQGPPVLPVPSVVAGSQVEGRPEDDRKDGQIRGRSHARAWFMKYPGKGHSQNRGRLSHCQ